MQREGGLRYDCSRLGDYKKYFHPQMQLAPHEVGRPLTGPLIRSAACCPV